MNTNTPRWGFNRYAPGLIFVKDGRVWITYAFTRSSAGGWQWQFHDMGVEPMFLAPEGAPLPDVETWTETHARILLRIESAVAQIVAEEVNKP